MFGVHQSQIPALEDQMCAFTTDFDRAAAGFSPDRCDALVWAFSELMVEPMASWGVYEATRRQAEALVKAKAAAIEAARPKSEPAPAFPVPVLEVDDNGKGDAGVVRPSENGARNYRGPRVEVLVHAVGALCGHRSLRLLLFDHHTQEAVSTIAKSGGCNQMTGFATLC